MDKLIVLVGTLLLCALHTESLSLKIIPEKSHLYVLEHDMLKLNCVYMYNDGEQRETLQFYKDGTLLGEGNTKTMGIEMTTHVKTVATVTTVTIMLEMNSTSMTSAGNYECRLGASGTNSNIKIHIFNVEGISDVIVKDVPKVTLGCLLNGLPPSINVAMQWTHDEKILENGDKYKMHDNNTMDVIKPERSDMGMYFCKLEFTPESTVDSHLVTPKEVVLKAGPIIDSHDNNKNMVQGDDLELKCDATGYPLPTVKWMKDNKPLNKTNRIHFIEYGSSKTGKLQIYSLDFDDEGMYTCIASSDVAPYNATADMRLRVKDKLAALWPFLGIVAEVVILCVIILIYERRRSKKLADEDDSADNNVDNTVDHKDVRHRRT